MDRRILLIFATLALVLQVRSDSVLKCYVCTSVNETCESPQSSHLEPMECTMNNIMEWQNKIKQHNILRVVLPAFEVTDLSAHNIKSKDMACAKMSFKLENNRNVTVRACQATKADNIDEACKVIQTRLGNNVMEHCSMCQSEACNGSYSLAPDFLGVAISILAAFVLAASRQDA